MYVSIKRLLFDYFYLMDNFHDDLEFVEIHKSRIKELIDSYHDGRKEDVKNGTLLLFLIIKILLVCGMMKK